MVAFGREFWKTPNPEREQIDPADVIDRVTHRFEKQDREYRVEGQHYALALTPKGFRLNDAELSFEISTQTPGADWSVLGNTA